MCIPLNKKIRSSFKVVNHQTQKNSLVEFAKECRLKFCHSLQFINYIGISHFNTTGNTRSPPQERSTARICRSMPENRPFNLRKNTCLGFDIPISKKEGAVLIPSIINTRRARVRSSFKSCQR